MRGFGKLGVAAAALAVGALGASDSFALQDDPYTSYTQPANALVMPFNVEPGQETFLLASNIAGESSISGAVAVTTHWTFWSENCDHLADVYMCLTLNDTVVVDPRNLSAQDVNNAAIGPQIDLGAKTDSSGATVGSKGIVIVTAYETDEICSDSTFLGNVPVDNALVGSYTIANTASSSAFGSDAIGLGLSLDFNNPYTELPVIASPTVDIQTFNPANLEESSVIFISLRERSGSGPTRQVEVGPYATPFDTDVVLYDNLEIATSLPQVRIRCAEFLSVRPQDDSVIPDSITVESSGFLRLSGFPTTAGGDRLFTYAVHGQAIGQFGAAANGKYKVSFQ